ncbi:MAG: selenide, water dikinase SelD, partial [Betaproteobacteria bacterium]
VEPIYGLVVIGLVEPRHLKRTAEAQPGDRLILGKGLGVGIYSAALKKDRLTAECYRAMIDSTTRLNTPGAALATLPGVHALTDVTGFGLLGHLLEVCRGSGVRARLDLARVPMLPGARALAAEGFITGASRRNWAGYGDLVDEAGMDETTRWLLCDPQTSGGLLVSCAPDAVQAVLHELQQAGFHQAALIGTVETGEPGVCVC